MARNSPMGAGGFINLLGSGLHGETQVPKYRVVLKVLILLQTWLHPVAPSGLIRKGKGFRMGWNAFQLQRPSGAEGGWTVQPSEDLVSDLHARWTGCHYLAESCHQPRGLRPRRQGIPRVRTLFLRSSCNETALRQRNGNRHCQSTVRGQHGFSLLQDQLPPYT